MDGVKLNPRLMAAAEFINENAVLADIGTDHAYLPVYLAMNGKIKRAIAADINEGPLSKARETILKYGVSDSVCPALSDGMKQLDLSEVTDVVIAGMGGELICKIIAECSNERLKFANIVLQPMTHADRLRKFLCENGYEIISEKAVRDRKFVYCVMRARFTGRIRHADRLFYSAGMLLHNRDEESLDYIKALAKKQRKKIRGLESSDSGETPADEYKFLSELERLVNEYESKRNI